MKPTRTKHGQGSESERDSVFSAEFQILRHAKESIERCANNPESALTALTELAEAYEKLLRQSIKITKIGDAAQRKLRAAQEKLEVLNAQKDEFLGIASHDLKNPLSAIHLTTEILLNMRDRMPPDFADQKLRSVLELSSRMHGIIRNLLDVNRIEQASEKSATRVCDLAHCVAKVLESNRINADAKSISIEYRSVDSPIQVQSDQTTMMQIIDNLISNAIKYSTFGTLVTVSVWTEDSLGGQTMARIAVVDQGPGISLEDQDKLFGRYQKLSARPTGGEESTGLGLANAKTLTELIGGTIWCESEHGKGATFHVRLPVLAENPKTLSIVGNDNAFL